MKNISTKATVDLFVCQLSTNDASQQKALGTVSDSSAMQEFDTTTVAGAIEYIIAYAKETWDCPVVFYTNPQYDSSEYAGMVALLHEIAGKWNIAVIDLWSDIEWNEITAEQRVRYMADPIHPTKEGYLEWWTPYFEKEINQIWKNNKDNITV